MSIGGCRARPLSPLVPKVGSLVAGMVAGADSIPNTDLRRHGGIARLFSGVRAPCTLGTFLHAVQFGHVRQLDAVAAREPAGLARHAPTITASEPVAYLDVGDTVRAAFGYAKQVPGSTNPVSKDSTRFWRRCRAHLRRR